MNKISQKQINEAAESHAKGIFSSGIYSNAEIFQKAIRWYRMQEIEAIDESNHPDKTNIGVLTSSDTITVGVDHWPEILEYLRKNHPHRYDVYRDSIAVFCESKKQRKKLLAEIDAVRSIKDKEVNHD